MANPMQEVLRKVAEGVIASSLSQGGVASDFKGQIPDEIPRELFVVPPEGRDNPFSNLKDPVFGFNGEGKPRIVVPSKIDPNDPKGKAKIGHEMVHFLQSLAIKDEKRRKQVGKPFTKFLGVPAPQKVENGVMERAFKARRSKLEDEARKIEDEILGL